MKERFYKLLLSDLLQKNTNESLGINLTELCVNNNKIM